MIRRHDRQVDVLFVNPPSPDGFVYIRDINRHGRSSWERMIWPQTSLAYLAAVAGQLDMSVDIVDCIAEEISWPRFEDILEKCRPRFCFSNIISVTYSNDLRALGQAKLISHAVTVGMGPHLTNAPGRSLQEAEVLDFIICHEAEATLKELLEVMKQERPPSLERLRKIQGIAFVPARILPGESQAPVVTEQRPFINDLDSLPWPRHDLLPLERYGSPFLGNYTFIEASRGCAYHCIFCRQAVMWQWKYRKRSGKAIAQEALHVHSLGVDTILFHADTFTLDRNLVEELCDSLIEAGAPFRWACNTHVKNLYGKPELTQKMKRAGCWMIAIGIESGDDEILRAIKKQITTAEAAAVVEMVDAAGIEAWGYFVLGFPNETKEHLEKTINFSLSLPLKIAKFDIAAPYPGTEFYQYCLEHNYLKAACYEEFDQNASAVVEYPNLSREKIKAAVRRANRRFYLRPRVLIRLLREIYRTTTFRTLFLIVRDQFRLLYSGSRVRRDAVLGGSQGASPHV
jgi:anaerobic magnesium-protoporphyrin IX monomethyl ester cyclase